ncbi:hypothetical protein SAMN05216436_101341 [bacterium A37T11]|nr:hypothetical protein SAMN05216436_101341 [bacterium A37T11]
MREKKALISFIRMSDEVLLSSTNTVIVALTGNAAYATPTPDMATVGAARDDFRDKLAAARRKGSPLETSIKNESRAALEKLLTQLAYYVNITAGGSLPVLLSSGFPVSAEPAPGLIPDSPGGLRLRDGRQRGQMRLDFTPVTGATGYEYRFTNELGSDGQPVFKDRFHTTSSRNNVLSPVEAAKVYYVQVRAMNTQGYGDWSYTLDYVARE